MYICGFRINANLVKEGSFRIDANLVKEELIAQLRENWIERAKWMNVHFIVRCETNKAD